MKRGKLQKVNTLIATGGVLKTSMSSEFLDAIEGEDFTTIVGVRGGEKGQTRGNAIDIAQHGNFTISTEGKKNEQK